MSSGQTKSFGIASILMAPLACTAFVYYVRNCGIEVQGNSIFIVTPFPTVTPMNLFAGYGGIATCLIGIAIGVFGYLRPNSQKLFAIVGALLNATLLLASLSVVGAFYYYVF